MAKSRCGYDPARPWVHARSEEGSLRDESPGNSHSRAASGTTCDSQRFVSLFRPQGALDFGPLRQVWAAAQHIQRRKEQSRRLFPVTIGCVGRPIRKTRIVAPCGAPCDSQASPRCIAHRARTASPPNLLGDSLLRFALMARFLSVILFSDRNSHVLSSVRERFIP